jgi:hypothetical protein
MKRVPRPEVTDYHRPKFPESSPLPAAARLDYPGRHRQPTLRSVTLHHPAQYSIWLLPRADQEALLAATIGRLGDELGGPRFAPT